MPIAFDIKLTGKLLPGHGQESVAGRLSSLMKISPEQATGMLGGRETTIKRKLEAGRVEQYIKTIEALGAEVRADPLPDPAPDPALALVTAPETIVRAAAELALIPKAADEEMKCPACGAAQPKRNLCRECGVDMPRMLAAQEDAARNQDAGIGASSTSSRMDVGGKKSPAANPFLPPSARVDDVATGENNSGGGSGTIPPPGVKGWSWGAFLLNWIWAVFNSTWIGLLCLVPYVGFVMSIYLGIKGRELAWRNKRWDSLEHFNRVQRRWSIWALILVVGAAGIGILAAIALPAYVDFARHAKAG